MQADFIMAAFLSWWDGYPLWWSSLTVQKQLQNTLISLIMPDCFVRVSFIFFFCVLNLPWRCNDDDDDVPMELGELSSSIAGTGLSSTSHGSKYYAQTYYVDYAHTGTTQKPHEHAYFLAPYVDNQLLCSLYGLKQSHAFNSAGFKQTTRFSSRSSNLCNFTTGLHQKDLSR